MANKFELSAFLNTKPLRMSADIADLVLTAKARSPQRKADIFFAF